MKKICLLIVLLIAVLLIVALQVAQGEGTPPTDISFRHIFPLPTEQCLKVDGRIVLKTTYFDTSEKAGRQHWDIPCAVGTPIYAIEKGVIERHGYEEGHAGLYIILVTDDGYRVVYGHCRATNPFMVLTGQRVNKGEVIAYSGNTGNSTGPHLHIQIFENGVPVPPIKLFGGRYHTSN